MKKTMAGLVIVALLAMQAGAAWDQKVVSLSAATFTTNTATTTIGGQIGSVIVRTGGGTGTVSLVSSDGTTLLSSQTISSTTVFPLLAQGKTVAGGTNGVTLLVPIVTFGDLTLTVIGTGGQTNSYSATINYEK